MFHGQTYRNACKTWMLTEFEKKERKNLTFEAKILRK